MAVLEIRTVFIPTQDRDAFEVTTDMRLLHRAYCVCSTCLIAMPIYNPKTGTMRR